MAFLPAVLWAQDTTNASSAMLRALDKVNGTVIDIEMSQGQTRRYGLLEITMQECRFPTDDPSGNAYVLMTIREVNAEAPVFQGWMVASSPALNALDHARYDVWPLRCITS
nr:DUF2155 domain-containing protein [Sulfitobacter algicola]